MDLSYKVKNLIKFFYFLSYYIVILHFKCFVTIYKYNVHFLEYESTARDTKIRTKNVTNN